MISHRLLFVWPRLCRFIPDDVTFDEEPKDKATEVDYGSYKPKIFTSTGTTTAKVWNRHRNSSFALNAHVWCNVCVVDRSSWRGTKRITTESRLSPESSTRTNCWIWTLKLTWPPPVRKRTMRKKQRKLHKVSLEELWLLMLVTSTYGTLKCCVFS